MIVGDLIAGLTVGIIALPLAMAFGIASIPDDVAQNAGLSSPAMGLYTAIVAGFIISALGGSRVQIGGPTGAFIVIVYGVAARHGYAGLATATFLAGAMVIAFGLCRLGAIIKLIPYPVTTGFTAGIAVVILSSQVKDFFGLEMASVPAEFVEKWQAYAAAASTMDFRTLGVALGALLMIVGLRRFAPRVPGAIVAIVAASAAVYLTGLDVSTIGTKFGGIPSSLPRPQMPALSLEMVREVLPDAFAIAVLAAIESLLSAVVADGMIGGRHKADCELVAQGLANMATAVCGGLPATGAIARTAANVKSGGRTPLAGIVHAVVLLGIMLLLGPMAKTIPLAALAAVLVMVAWNMSEIDHIRAICRGPKSDIALLAATFGLTVFTDLTIAVTAGVVLAALLFIKQMADVTRIDAIPREAAEDELGELSDPNSIESRDVPAGVEVYEIHGPLFFGVAHRLQDILRQFQRPPQVFVVRMRKVSRIDASGLRAVEELHRQCQRQGTVLLLSGVHAQPLFMMDRTGLNDVIGADNMFGGIDDALNRARELLGLPAREKPVEAVAEVAREREPPATPAEKREAA